jgi:hypothetical protein
MQLYSGEIGAQNNIYIYNAKKSRAAKGCRELTVSKIVHLCHPMMLPGIMIPLLFTGSLYCGLARIYT